MVFDGIPNIYSTMFNENRSCIEIPEETLSIIQAIEFNENRSCIEIIK